VRRYPQSVRNAVYDKIRSGTTPGELKEHYGIGWGTAYRWLDDLRADGEVVAFTGRWDHLRDAAFVRFAQGASVQELFDELGVDRSQLYGWREQFEQPAPSVAAAASGRSAGKTEPSDTRRQEAAEPSKDARIRRLETALAQKTLEVDFFSGALREVEAKRRPSTGSGAKRSTGKSSR